MNRFAKFCVCVFLLTSSALAQTHLPSGQRLVLWEIRWERVPGTEDIQIVLRALAPELNTVRFETAVADMVYVCENYAVPLAQKEYSFASQAVINLSDRPVARGQIDAQATQYFEVFRIENATCVSENF